MTTFRERLFSFIKSTGLTTNGFENYCHLSTGTIAKMKEGINTQNLVKIAVTYPELDTRWLLTGVRDDNRQVINIHNRSAEGTNSSVQNIEGASAQEVSMLKNENDRLRAELDAERERSAKYWAMIEKLADK